MKFQVRAGFVIHDTRVVKVNEKPVEQTNSYYEGDSVDFDEATALNHLHKLEPVDKPAVAFASARFAPVSAPPVAGIDPAQMATLIAQAVAAAMAAQATAAAAAAAPALAPAKAPA